MEHADDHSESGNDLWFDPPPDDQDPGTPPWVVDAPGAPDWLDPAKWLEAEARAGRRLADAAAAVARLDEHLALAGPERAGGLAGRLAIAQVSDLLWAEGVRLRPEQLALAAEDRLGLSALDAHAVARADWAVRRLQAGAGDLDGRDAVRAFLGMHDVARDPGDDLPWRPDPAGPEDWCRAVQALDSAHPLTRAGYAQALWQGFELSAPGRRLEGAVAAACLGAADLRALKAVPADPDLAGGSAGMRLEQWLGGVARAAVQALMVLRRIAAWETEAAGRTRGMKGKAAPRLTALLGSRPVLSAKAAARALDITPSQARSLLNAFEGLGLTRERTGHRRFRFWEARI